MGVCLVTFCHILCNFNSSSSHNNCTKNYWNLTAAVEIIVECWVCAFLQHSVYPEPAALLWRHNHLHRVTNSQLLSTGTGIQLESFGCGWPSCIIIVHVWMNEPQGQVTMEKDVN